MADLRSQTKQATRKALCEAGEALFREQGFDSPSLDAICAKAGFTRGAFYVHFADRGAFVAEVVHQALERLILRLFAGSPSLLEVVERFTEVLESDSGAVLGPDGLGIHHILHAANRSPGVRTGFTEALTAVRQRLIETTKREQAGNALPAHLDAAGLSTTLVGLATGLAALGEAGFPVDPQATRNTVLALVSR